ncbi:MAG: DciA family protein [Thermosynechococcaceae cyanobacterium]
MTLEPVNQVLGKFRKTQGQQQREFGKLQQAWADIVGPVVAAQTQPSQITSQQALIVSTSSGVWAQNLAFERQRILTKLNVLLKTPLTDIRFSTSQWRSRRPSTKQSSEWTPKSLVTGPSNAAPALKTEDHQAVFQRWSERVKSQSLKYPLCPKCHCATPPAEIQRWSVCCLCAVRPDRSDPQTPRNSLAE